MEEQKDGRERWHPLERRELKGLTLEALIKYGTIIIAIVAAYYILKNDVSSNAKSIEQNKLRFEKIEKDIEAIKTYREANEIWKARMEEKVNAKKQ